MKNKKAATCCISWDVSLYFSVCLVRSLQGETELKISVTYAVISAVYVCLCACLRMCVYNAHACYLNILR